MLGINSESSSFFTFMTLEICRLICPIKLVFKDTRLYRYILCSKVSEKRIVLRLQKKNRTLSFGTDHLQGVSSLGVFFEFDILGT